MNDIIHTDYVITIYMLLHALQLECKSMYVMVILTACNRFTWCYKAYYVTFDLHATYQMSAFYKSLQWVYMLFTCSK